MPVTNVNRRWIVLLATCCMAATAGTALANSHMKEGAKKDAAPAAAKSSEKVAEKAAGKSAATDPARDMMAEAMAKLAMPGDKHAWMKGAEGKWKTTVKSWFAPGEPAVSEGTAEMKMVLGGRYLEQRFKTTMMDQPFEGFGLQGYDNAKQTFWSIWIDNSSTGVMMSEGTLDESGKVLTFTGKGPAPDGTPVDYRMVTKIVDDKSHVFTMYANMGGQEAKMMEITYTRM